MKLVPDDGISYGKSQLYDPYGITLTSNNKHLSHRYNKSFIFILFNTCTEHKRQRHLKRIERSKKREKTKPHANIRMLRILFSTHAVLILSLLLFYSYSMSSHLLISIHTYSNALSKDTHFEAYPKNHTHKCINKI